MKHQISFKSIASPEPGAAPKLRGPKLVVPNQAMSLQTILERFTRGEPLEIGRGQPQFDEGPEDLEKLAHADLVDKAEAAEKFRETQRKYKKQENLKHKVEKERLDKLAVEKLASDKKAAEEAAKNAK